MAAGLALIASLLLVSGCFAGAAPPVHPMGAGCTWPADLDPQRDGLAVVAAAGSPRNTRDLVLLDVATSGVRARCTGLALTDPYPSFLFGDRWSPGSPTESVLFPTVSPDWSWAISSAGLVELATGRVVLEPSAGWRTVALPGEGRALRERVPADPPDHEGDNPYVATNWCLAPRLDASEQECQVLSGDGPGFPTVGRDGTVSWAPAVPVGVQLDRLSGVVQTDGSRIVQLRVDADWEDDHSVVDASGRAGLLGRYEFGGERVNGKSPGLPGWYTIEGIGPSGATGHLHSGFSSWQDVENLDPDLRLVAPLGAMVVDGGRAVIVALRARETAVFVRIAEDSPARVVARLQTPAVGDVPRIYAWPDSASSVDA